MKRIMVCDDDKATVERLLSLLRGAGYEAEACRHTMDVLREAADGNFALVALSLDMSGFGRSGAAEVLGEIAPRTALVGFYNKPLNTLRHATRLCFAAILPRPVSNEDFIQAVRCALAHHSANAPAASVRPPARRSLD